MMRRVLPSAGLLLLVLLTSCAPPPVYNDPDTDTFDPNYPVVRRKLVVPHVYEDQEALLWTPSHSIFFRTWADPRDSYARAQAAVKQQLPGYESLKRDVLEREPRHALKTVCDDDLVFLVTWVFFGRDEEMQYGKGTYRVIYADDTSSLDQGVRVNMAGNRRQRSAVRRSFTDEPLTVGQAQRNDGERAVPLLLLMPREDLGKEVARVEVVE